MRSATLDKLVNSAIRSRSEEAALSRVVQISKQDPRQVVDQAVHLTHSNREWNRYLGVWFLAEIGFPQKPLLQERLATLRRVVMRDSSDTVRARAICSLGALKCESATNAIRSQRKSKSAMIRLAVAQSLPPDGSGQTIAALTRLAGDTNAEVREWATFNLGTQPANILGTSKRCIKTLQAKLHDSSQSVRLEAIRGLIIRGEFSALRQFRMELKRLDSASKFFEHWHRTTVEACDKRGFDYLLMSCFEELMLSLNPSVKPLVSWS